ncbi:hypothetical protein [Thiobacter aerophilum]|uniref:Lipoprotein n=1 Tax=Thiobacter aerophilum TaxID=3121275 RepID=A0ABV0EG86_9BURK
MNKTLSVAVVVMIGMLALAGCKEQASTTGAPNTGERTDSKSTKEAVEQSTFCKVGLEALFGAVDCKPGQKIAFLPEQFCNEQLPILFAAGNCDLRYNVALTRGGVVCIYLPAAQQKKSEPEEQKKR